MRHCHIIVRIYPLHHLLDLWIIMWVNASHRLSVSVINVFTFFFCLTGYNLNFKTECLVRHSGGKKGRFPNSYHSVTKYLTWLTAHKCLISVQYDHLNPKDLQTRPSFISVVNRIAAIILQTISKFGLHLWNLSIADLTYPNVGNSKCWKPDDL